jgi:hypothetical protein
MEIDCDPTERISKIKSISNLITIKQQKEYAELDKDNKIIVLNEFLTNLTDLIETKYPCESPAVLIDFSKLSIIEKNLFCDEDESYETLKDIAHAYENAKSKGKYSH